MSYRVTTVANFRKEAKKLMKKYPSLKNELAELGSQLSHEPTAGTSLGNNCYKIRLAMASKGKDKSGGARVITHFYVAEATAFYSLSTINLNKKILLVVSPQHSLGSFIKKVRTWRAFCWLGDIPSDLIISLFFCFKGPKICVYSVIPTFLSPL